METKRFGRLTRRRFLKLAGSAAVLGGAALTYAWQVEPFRLEVVRRDLPVRGLPGQLAGKTLVQVSDLHIGTTDAEYLADCLRLVGTFEPDLVVVTGDFMTCDRGEQLDAVPGVMRHLAVPPLGAFAVTGNHDFGHFWHYPDVADGLAKRLADGGVTVLRNDVRDVAGLQLAGVDDLWSPCARPGELATKLDPARPGVVLCHNPDGADRPELAGLPWWVLSGHTHGGQCRLPGLPPPVLHVKNRAYVAGEYDLGGGRRLYVNRGLGYAKQLRFGVRPEVTVFTLTAG